MEGSKKVTLGWDGLPTILNADGTVYGRCAELIFHKEFYPKWPKEQWPIDPKTGRKLPAEKTPNDFQIHRSKGVLSKIRTFCKRLAA